MKKPTLALDDLLTARRHLAGGVRRTPCHLAPALTEMLGRSIWLKREDLQRTGAFKERGARNALQQLAPAARVRGVVAASAGNHALGLAFHGAALGVPVTVVMPLGAPAVKITRCRGLGATVLQAGNSFDEAQRFAAALAAERGATLVHPFDDPAVIAGQGTLALELLEQAPAIDCVVVPVGGGGLLAGVALAVKALRPSVRVVGVEPENAAGFLAACLRGERSDAALAPTLADGLAVARVGELSLALAAPLLDDLVTVSERELGEAIALLARHAGVVAEGAGAAAFAAVLAGKVAGRAFGVPITGRNIDPARHAAVLDGVPVVEPVRDLRHAA
jgi:threonine dehydratase